MAGVEGWDKAISLLSQLLAELLQKTEPADLQNVNIVSGGGGGTQYTQGSAAADTDQLTLAGAVRADTAAVATGVTDGDRTRIIVDATGRVWAHVGTIDGGTITSITNVVHVDDNGGSLTVDGTLAISNFPATQPVSGTVTANQGGAWNLTNISGTVSLPTGAATETTLATRLADATFTGRINTQGQKAMTASTPVVIASDQSAVPVSGTITTTPPANASTNVAQFGGTNVSTGTGASGAGIPRVTVANDSIVTANAGTNLNTSALLLDSTFTGRVNTQGQKTMAASTPVVLASDQAAIPVTESGTWTVQPGNTANTTPWLTSTKTDLAPAAPATVVVGTSSAQAVAANASRKGLHLRNTSSLGQRISLSLNGAAVLDSGYTLYPQDVFEMAEYDFDLGLINAISSAIAGSLAIQEWS